MKPDLLTCRKCRRLDNQFKKLRITHPDYWNRPVPASGREDARILVVGLAPGMHGANRTGKPFEGDASGNLLHKVLQDLDLAGQVRITNAVKCLPVKNLPSGREVSNCRPHLARELSACSAGTVLFVLGGVAHRAVIAALGLKQGDYPFGHGTVHDVESHTLVDSYHCSRYNTQTGRLTEAMFRDALQTARDIAYP